MSEIEIKLLPIDSIEENPWNPNVMSDAKFNRLTEEIQNIGFIDPIQVVPVENNRYRIIGGAHRYNAAIILGYDEIPSMILSNEKFKDKDYQKFVTMRLNIIKGDMTPEKFQKLYLDLAKRYNDEKIKEALALVDDEEWENVKRKLLKELKEKANESGMTDDEFSEAVRELKTLDDITKLLELIYRDKENGNLIRKIFAVGTGGGKVQKFEVSEDTWNILDTIMIKLIEKGMVAKDVFKESIKIK